MLARMNGPSDLPLSSLEVDESLENRLKAHGLSRRNVKSIIRSIFTDKNVVKLLEGNDENSLNLDIPHARVTRSKGQTSILDDVVDYDNFDPDTDFTSHEDQLFDPDADLTSHGDQLQCLSAALNDDTNASSIWTGCNNNTLQHKVFTADDDAYIDENGEFDWRSWLDDEKVSITNVTTTQDSDSDPDYNFLGEFEERDEEDYRYDRTTKISKEEVKSLQRKRKRRNRSAGREQIGKKRNKRVLTADDKSQNHTDAINTFLQCLTAHEKLRILRSNPNMQISRKPNTVKIEFFSFTNTQMSELNQQMQQHVQLLAQTCILDKAGTTNARCLLQEIRYFATASCNPEMSAFNAINVGEAIEICTRLSLSALQNDESLIKQSIAESPVFMYKELLPRAISICEQNLQRVKFSFNEDCLIAHGCHEMVTNLAKPFDLIQQLLLPHRSTKEISDRIKTVMNGRLKNFSFNPIFKFRTLGLLPEPSKQVTPVYAGNIRKPIDMSGNLPKWLGDAKNAKIREAVLSQNETMKTAVCKLSAKNSRRSHCGSVCIFWTKEMDKKILQVVQENGALSEEALSTLSEILPTRTSEQIEQRFLKLMKIYRAMNAAEK